MRHAPSLRAIKRERNCFTFIRYSTYHISHDEYKREASQIGRDGTEDEEKVKCQAIVDDDKNRNGTI